MTIAGETEGEIATLIDETGGTPAVDSDAEVEAVLDRRDATGAVVRVAETTEDLVAMRVVAIGRSVTDEMLEDPTTEMVIGSKYIDCLGLHYFSTTLSLKTSQYKGALI